MTDKRVLRTRVFRLAESMHIKLSDLATLMDLDFSTLHRVRKGERNIGPAFIIGARKAFPKLDMDDLFYIEEGSSGTGGSGD